MSTKSKDLQLVDKITCPQCGEVIPISERLSHEIAETTRKQIAEKVAEEVATQREAIEKSAIDRAQGAMSVEVEDLRRQAAEKDQQLDILRKTELGVLQQKREVEAREKSLELDFQRRIDAEKENDNRHEQRCPAGAFKSDADNPHHVQGDRHLAFGAGSRGANAAAANSGWRAPDRCPRHARGCNIVLSHNENVRRELPSAAPHFSARQRAFPISSPWTGGIVCR